MFFACWVHVPAIHAASRHADHEKRVAHFSISRHACGFLYCYGVPLEEVNSCFFFLSYMSMGFHFVAPELEKAEETLTYRLLFPQHFSFSQTSTLVFIKQLYYELEISIVR